MTAPAPAPERDPSPGAGPALDRRAVAVGAAVCLLVAGVPIALLRLAVGSEVEGGERNVWVVAVMALFAGFALGGHVAARRGGAAPYRHAAASSALAFAVFVAFTVARRLVAGDGLSVPVVTTLAVMGQISVSLALLGAYVAGRTGR